MKTKIEDEQKCISMYRDYGIAEWQEKTLVLTELEKLVIERNLGDGVDSPLVQLAKLPFPLFAEAYFKRIKNRGSRLAKYIEDPAFGYKLFLLRDTDIKFLSELIRNPELSTEDVRGFHNSEVKEIFENPLDYSYAKSSPTKRRGQSRDMKYIYLTQYIGYEEAKKLGLKMANTFEIDKARGLDEDGFEFEYKLDTLNLSTRFIFARLFGLYGHNRHTLREIAKLLHVSDDKIPPFYDDLIPVFLRTLGDFKNKTGFVEKDYAPNETREYTNRKYRSQDLDLMIKFIYNFGLTDSEKLVLSSKSNKEVNLYIANKYIYNGDTKKCMEYLLIEGTPQDYEGSFGTL